MEMCTFPAPIVQLHREIKTVCRRGKESFEGRAAGYLFKHPQANCCVLPSAAVVAPECNVWDPRSGWPREFSDGAVSNFRDFAER